MDYYRQAQQSHHAVSLEKISSVFWEIYSKVRCEVHIERQRGNPNKNIQLFLLFENWRI